MLLTFFQFFLSAGAIYLACEYFVNAIEWLGRRLNLGATAVGSVLAAFGTALPESAVTFIAVVFGTTPAQKDIGVGAAMGGPLVLATLAYAVVGLALIFHRHRLERETLQVRVDHARMSRDQAAFLLVFVVKVALGLVAFAIKPWLGVLFLAAYVVYVWREIQESDTAPEEEEIEPLRIRSSVAEPSLGWAALQAVLALVVIGVASHVFVGQLEAIGAALATPPGGFAVESGGNGTAGDDERTDLGAAGQGAPGTCQHFRGHDDTGHHSQRSGHLFYPLAF